MTSSDSTRIGELVSWGMLDITWGATRILTSFVFMLIINWKLALVVIAIIPILVVVAARFKRKILKTQTGALCKKV